MIERLGASSTTADTLAIQPASVTRTPVVPESQQAEVLVHSATLIGETHWLGAMNAFRIARTLETQHSEQSGNQNKSATIPYDGGLLQGAKQSAEPALIPTVPQISEDAEVSNHLNRPLERESEAPVTVVKSDPVRTDTVTRETTEVVEAAPLPTNTTSPAVFRGQLVRLGDSVFGVRRLGAALAKPQ